MDVFRPFSKRYQQAIWDRRIRPSIPKRLRKRLSLILRDYNYYFRANGSFVADEVHWQLRKAYGVDELQAFVEGGEGERVSTDVYGLVLQGYPSEVLDVIELWYQVLPKDKDRFQREVNNAFEEEACPWRMVDGCFFQVDSEFLELQLLQRADNLLKDRNFLGPLDEFRAARNDLALGDYKDAIVNACKSFESTLKILLKRSDGNASSLIRELAPRLLELPEDTRSAFGQQVLMALPFLRNRLGGHGQGPDVISVSRPYAELAIHLAGAYILFVSQALIKESDDNLQSAEIDDDVPF